MIAFHIDMNVAQFRREYLEKWLKELAGLGYDTILWEVENNIAWETCPECVSPDAFGKAEFREILGLCRELKLDCIPLLQTIAHCEYVLKHDRYKPMSELEGSIDQYCPRHPEVVPFLHRWIDEYLELFGPIRYFHIGADEAWSLGRCDACRSYARVHSLSQLYIDHINAISSKFESLGITPIIWADMVLHHHEALDKLSRKIMLFDWMYDIHRGNGRFFVWGKGQRTAADLTSKEIGTFGKYLFPYGDEPGRDPETFYSADYLADHGFKVVTCPSSASAGDSVFSPRHFYHAVNTFDSFQKGRANHLYGSVLTSWTVRLHPWELQTSSIDIPGYLARCPQATLEDFQAYYIKERFGLEDSECGLWEAFGLLSKRCSFMDSLSLGFDKHTMPVPKDFVQKQMAWYIEHGQSRQEYQSCLERVNEYRRALQRLETVSRQVRGGQELLAIWKLAARNLINRAEVALFLFRSAEADKCGIPAGPSHWETGRKLHSEMRQLKIETAKMYSHRIKPTRCGEIVSWIFDAVDYAMTSLLEK